MDKITIDTYNKGAQEYDEGTVNFWERFPMEIIERFSDEIAVNGRVLNVGAGPGRDGLLLKEKRHDVLCLDASSAMVEACKSRGLQAVEGDFLDLQVDDSSLDGVWAYTSLLHINKTEFPKALSEIARVLKSHGVFGIGMVEGEGEHYQKTGGMNEGRLFAFYKEDELEKYLADAGFEIVYKKVFQPRTSKYLNYICRKVD